MRGLLLLLLCTRILSAPVGAAEPTRTLQVRWSPPLGPWYRPGFWVLVQAEIQLPPDCAGTWRPEAQLLEEGRIRFRSRLAPRPLEPGLVRLTFAIRPGETAPTLRLALLAAGKNRRPPILGETSLGALRPLAPAERLLLQLGPTGRSRPAGPGIAGAHFVALAPDRLPPHPDLLASCDVLILGEETLGTSQTEALAAWLMRGGVMIVTRQRAAEAIASAIEQKGWRLSPAAPLRPPPGADGARLTLPAARRAGLGMIIDLTTLPPEAQATTTGALLWRALRAQLRGAGGSLFQQPKEPPKALLLPPRGPVPTLLLWLGLWLLLLLALRLLPPLGARPRLRTALLGLASLAFALLFLKRTEPAPPTALALRIERVGEAGGASLIEVVRGARTFSSAESCQIPIDIAALPRPLTPLKEAWSEGLLQHPDGTFVFARIPPASHVRSDMPGAPLLLSSIHLGPQSLGANRPLAAPQGNELRLADGGGSLRPLTEALFLSGMRCLALGTIESLPWRGATTRVEATTDRTRAACWVLSHIHPGNFGLLAGWEEGEGLGTLRLISTDLLPESTE